MLEQHKSNACPTTRAKTESRPAAVARRGLAPGPKIIVQEASSSSQHSQLSESHDGINETRDLGAHEVLVKHIGQHSPDSQIRNPQAGLLFPNSILYTMHVHCRHSSELQESNEFHPNDASSYQEIEKRAMRLAEKAQDGPDEAKTTILRSGYCTVAKPDGTSMARFRLTCSGHWSNVLNNSNLLKDLESDGQQKLTINIYREYQDLQLLADEDPFLKTKKWELDEMIKKNIDDRDYISEADLQAYTSNRMIKGIIGHDPCWEPRLSSQEIESLADKIVKKNARRFLAMCIYTDVSTKCLEKLVDKGYHDHNLPQLVETCCKSHSKRRKPLARYHGIFQTASFNEPREYNDIPSYITIPLIPVDAERATPSDRQTSLASEPEMENFIQARKSAKGRALIGEGAHGFVYRVRLEPSHHNLSDDPYAEFALKEFKPKPKGLDVNFAKESDMLQSLRKFAEPHLTTHIVSWTQGEKYYMLFPLAKCNLQEYMSIHTFRSTKDEKIWLLKQILGLAGALRRIHDLTFNNPLAGDPNLSPGPLHGQERKAGWHHDLKGQNILCFEVNEDLVLQIADFGSSKIHIIRSRSHPTRTVAGTPTYEPPELEEEGSTSRPHDVWSLGCVFLELLVWAVLGFNSLKEFEEKRIKKRVPDQLLTDNGYWEMRDGKVELRPAVKDWIEKLKVAIANEPQQPFKELPNVILAMLNLNRERRLTARDVYHRIDDIYNRKKLELEQSLNISDLTGADFANPIVSFSNESDGSDRLSLDMPLDTSPRPLKHTTLVSGAEHLTSSPTEAYAQPGTRIQSRQSSNSDEYAPTPVRAGIGTATSRPSVRRGGGSGSRGTLLPHSPRSGPSSKN
ncbi:uncharacterized protein KY384_001201 [Bacidia gigantensis]|uniref:uncharacterized protein n=1 Tax=Bacidia gigantensis TaxID=2732470 RepID=UPI001D058FB8|nr:uncharacterized protein KY384_001201 [Bacidia gigantensis]KAG8534357.1 hypothetical protein KY384_001201 [Bacidia gigantensis]